ncbi:hypothetical protein SLI_5141 [Streptomyces lividans 1326]|uniref:Uncharacterized protein n=1 Tax=Streptomyces lividans 1326 TaxID=1200984 RepID=A0A7U9DTK2_STRLI|nr:hypothetical protein SLI_5141 [Streptomyces lividans 1326]
MRRCGGTTAGRRMGRGRDRGNVSRPRRGARAAGTGGTPAQCESR